MKRKHPERKREIAPLTTEELSYSRRTLDREWFGEKLRKLKFDVAPGLGCLRNEHLLALLINPGREVCPSAQSAVENYFDYACAVVQAQLPAYFYAAWVACRLVPTNKVDPDELPPDTPPDCRPVGIGSSERRHITQAYYDDGLQGVYRGIVSPVQNGVGVKNGISITAFGVQAAVDANP